MRDRTLVVTMRAMDNRMSVLQEDYKRLELQRDKLLGLIKRTRLAPLIPLEDNE